MPSILTICNQRFENTIDYSSENPDLQPNNQIKSPLIFL